MSKTVRMEFIGGQQDGAIHQPPMPLPEEYLFPIAEQMELKRRKKKQHLAVYKLNSTKTKYVFERYE